MKIFICLLASLFMSSSVYSQLTVNGQWDFLLSITDITEAGLDYPTEFESTANETEITWSSELFTPLLTCTINLNNYA